MMRMGPPQQGHGSRRVSGVTSWLRFLRARLFRGPDAEQRTAFGEVCFADAAGQ